MAREGPVRALVVFGAGRIQKPRRRLGDEPRGALWFGFGGGLAEPAAEKTADYGDDAADVFILAGGEPAPVVSEAEEEAEFVKTGVGIGEFGTAWGTAADLGFKELFGEVEGGAEEAGGDGGAVGAGE